jgi:hypothetical protein
MAVGAIQFQNVLVSLTWYHYSSFFLGSCPPLINRSVSLKCFEGNKEVNCRQIQKHGNIVSATCKSGHINSYLKDNECIDGFWTHDVATCKPGKLNQFEKLQIISFIIDISLWRTDRYRNGSSYQRHNSSTRIGSMACRGLSIIQRIGRWLWSNLWRNHLDQPSCDQWYTYVFPNS